MSTLYSKDFKFDPENDTTGIEILDMHRKIIAEVSKVKFNDAIMIIEHIPK